MRVTALSMFLVFVLAAAICAADSTEALTVETELNLDHAANDTVATVSEKTSGAATVQYPMSPERHEKLVGYSQFKNIWRFVGFFISLAIAAAILFSGLAARFRDWTSGIKSRFLSRWAFVAIYFVADYIMYLPFSIYRSYLVEVKYGFINQTFFAWWGEDLLNLLIVIVIAIVPIWFLYQLIARHKNWWAWFAAGSLPFLVVMVIIVPVLISPLFNDFGPMKDKQLETEILALAEQAGIGGADVFEVNASKQSSKLNAYVTGLFGSKRIVLYDTLIDNFTYDEIKFVMAHEMGHYVKHHMWQGLLLTVLFMVGALWLMNRMIHAIIARFKDRFRFDNLADIASLPLIMALVSIIFFVFQPITNGFTRYMEHECDIYGMEMSGVSGEAAALAFDKLAVFNLSDPDPNPIVEFWFYDHPALKKRMAFVRSWGK